MALIAVLALGVVAEVAGVVVAGVAEAVVAGEAAFASLPTPQGMFLPSGWLESEKEARPDRL